MYLFVLIVSLNVKKMFNSKEKDRCCLWEKHILIGWLYNIQ